MERAAEKVALGLGSNLGDRAAVLGAVITELSGRIRPLAVSSLFQSAPVGFLEQPDFLNCVFCGETDLSPRQLLELCREVEDSFGRVRSFPNAPRTVDIDILLFGSRVVSEPGLVVPHPRMRSRAFVLVPLAEVAPDWMDPGTSGTVQQLLNEIGEAANAVHRYGAARGEG